MGREHEAHASFHPASLVPRRDLPASYACIPELRRAAAGASMAAFVHAVFPFLFTTTASASVKRLYERMTRRCATCPSGRVHRPDLFVRKPEARVYEQSLMYEI